MGETARMAGTTKDRIMGSALGLFLERGYLGASVRDIADANGVTVPALYYHFTNKDDLLAAIVAPLADDGDALIERLDARRVPPDELPAVALGGYFDVLAAHLDVFRFVSTDLAVRRHPVAGHRLAAQQSRFTKLLAGPRPSRARRLCAAAAIGAIRRPLRRRDIDPTRDREQILAAALAAHAAVIA
ncbi:MAG: TetR/AcrR family transcriptional regulator [Acidimicrobiales bacterium]|nr:TetR/AcrR family transcriptional regulator [Acidimicrobiales bacterium]